MWSRDYVDQFPIIVHVPNDIYVEQEVCDITFDDIKTYHSAKMVIRFERAGACCVVTVHKNIHFLSKPICYYIKTVCMD